MLVMNGALEVAVLRSLKVTILRRLYEVVDVAIVISLKSAILRSLESGTLKEPRKI